MIREQKVLLDADLAALYGVETKVLRQAVKTNRERFADDFMFQLTAEEFDDWRSPSVISSWGGRRYRPCALIEQGVAMLSSVLRSPQAIAVNIEIIWAFVRLRELLASQQALAKRLEELKAKTNSRFK